MAILTSRNQANAAVDDVFASDGITYRVAEVIDGPTGRYRWEKLIDSRVDNLGTINLAPSMYNGNNRTGIEMDFVDAATGQFIEPIAINSFGPIAGATNNNARWAIQMGCTNFGGTTDYHQGIGLFGNISGGSEINVATRESTYDIGGSNTNGPVTGVTSHEIYDVIQHFDWATSRRVGWCYSSFSTRTGHGGDVGGIAAFDNVGFTATDPNVANPTIGTFGTYFAITPNPVNGDISVQASTPQGGQFVQQITGGVAGSASRTRIVVNRPLAIAVDRSGSLAAGLSVQIENASNLQFFPTQFEATFADPGNDQAGFRISAPVRASSDLLEYRATRNGGSILSCGVGSTSTAAWWGGVRGNNSYIVHSGGGTGLVVGTETATPIVIMNNFAESARFTPTGNFVLQQGLVLAERTIATLPAVGTAGERYAVSNSAVRGGRMAYWAGTLWSYEDGTVV